MCRLWHPVRSSLVILLVLLMAFQPLLVGCNGDNGTGPGEQDWAVETEQTSGRVDVSEIGGDSLAVVSAWDAEQQVSEGGEFEVNVSSEGAQLLLLQDASGETRALSISIPSAALKAEEPLDFNATSTAIALLMMSPGILTVDPEEAVSRRTEFQGLNGFDELVTALRDGLPGKSLAVVVDDPQVVESLTECMIAWEAAQTAKQPGSGNPSTKYGEDHFNAEILDYSNPGETKIQLTNAAWRFVAVHRRDLDIGQQEENTTHLDLNEFPGLESMNGVVPFGWGSIFTSRVLDPTLEQDKVDFLVAGGVSASEYWVGGIGWGEGSLTLPDGLEIDRTEAIAATIAFYIAFPIIDLWLGFSKLLDMGGDAVRVVWNLVKGGISVTEIVTATEAAERHDAAVDLAFAILSICATAGSTGGLLGLSAAVWGAVGPFLAVFAVLFGGINVALAVYSWYQVPAYDMVSVQNPADLVPPGGVEDLAVDRVTSSSADLAWTAPGDDGSVGQAAQYDIRYATSEELVSGWDDAIQCAGEPLPKTAGASESFTVGGLEVETTYYFGLKTLDDADNWSETSNIVSASTDLDTVTISYDNGDPDYVCSTEGYGGFAVRFTSPGYPCRVLGVKYLFPSWWGNDARVPFEVVAFDSQEVMIEGLPTTKPLWFGWHYVDLSDHGLCFEAGDFYLGLFTNSENPKIGADGSGGERSYAAWPDGLTLFEVVGDIMIRAVVEYQVPEFTSDEMKRKVVVLEADRVVRELPPGIRVIGPQGGAEDR